MSQLSHSILSNIFSKLFGFLGIIFILLALNVHMMRTNDFKVLNEYLGISKIFAAIVYDPEDCYGIGSVKVDCNSKWHNAPATTTVRIQNGGVGAITYTTTILPPPPPVTNFGGGDGGGGH